MKITGVIVEYNPFHNGHKYHLQEARRLTGADFIVAIMSGNFVQRGTPAITDKYTRTKMALLNGADIVYELPTAYAVSSAEGFAYGAVSHLDALRNIDFLCFGCESSNEQLMHKIAELLVEEPPVYKRILKSELAKGISYPIARKTALLPLLLTYPAEEVTTFLESSNNILGIEYIKALHRLRSTIKPILLKREGALYNDESLSIHSPFSSATAIRKQYTEAASLQSIQEFIPPTIRSLLEECEHQSFPVNLDDFSEYLYYKLQFTSFEELLTYADVTADLAMRILNKKQAFITISSFAEVLKTKQYTATRINRVLLHILLHIKKAENTPSYLHLLGFKKNATKAIDTALSSLPIITKVADYKDLLKQDMACTELYNHVVKKKFQYTIANDFTHPLIIL